MFENLFASGAFAQGGMPGMPGMNGAFRVGGRKLKWKISCTCN